MGDVSSGMASTVIQLYLKEVLGSFLHPSAGVRCSAMRVVQLVLAQGLVHPVQVGPHTKSRGWLGFSSVRKASVHFEVNLV